MIALAIQLIYLNGLFSILVIHLPNRRFLLIYTKSKANNRIFEMYNGILNTCCLNLKELIYTSIPVQELLFIL